MNCLEAVRRRGCCQAHQAPPLRSGLHSAKGASCSCTHADCDSQTWQQNTMNLSCFSLQSADHSPCQQVQRTCKDSGRFCGRSVLRAQREEVRHVLRLEEAPLPRVLQHLQIRTAASREAMSLSVQFDSQSVSQLCLGQLIERSIETRGQALAEIGIICSQLGACWCGELPVDMVVAHIRTGTIDRTSNLHTLLVRNCL